MIEDFIYPIVAFLIILVIVFLGYVITGSWGPKYKKEKYKKQSYACGEDYQGGKLHHSYNFFHIAFFFTVLHVGALLITTAPEGIPALIGLLLLGAMGLTAFALFVGGKDHD